MSKKKHALRISFFEDGQPDLDTIEVAPFNTTPSGAAIKDKWKLRENDPADFNDLINGKAKITDVHHLTVIATNSNYCYWTISGGVLVRK